MFLKKISVLLISSLSVSFAMQGAGLESEVERKQQKEIREIQPPVTLAPHHPSAQVRSVLVEALATAKSERVFKEGDEKILESVLGRIESILDKYSPEVMREVSKKLEAESRAEISVSSNPASLSQSGGSATRVEVERKQKAEEAHKGLDAPDITKLVPTQVRTISRSDFRKQYNLQALAAIKSCAITGGKAIATMKKNAYIIGRIAKIKNPLGQKYQDDSIHVRKLRMSEAGIHEGPTPITDPISDALKESMISSYPFKIKSLVGLWKSYLDGKVSEIDFPFITKRLLLMGVPGTGKTTMGKAIAADCGIPYFMYKGASIVTSYKDSGAGNLDKIFTHARRHMPCVLIVDEIGTLLQKHHNKHDTEASMLTHLWSNLDEHKKMPIFFIATANELKDAPEAFDSRFGNSKIMFVLPDCDERADIIKRHITYLSTGNSKKFEGIDIQRLAKKTKHFSHRHLEQVIGDALQIYLERGSAASADDYDRIIAQIKKSDSSLNYSKQIDQAFTFLKEHAPAGVGHVIQLGVHAHNVKLQAKHHEDSRIAQATSLAAQIDSSAIHQEERDDLDYKNRNGATQTARARREALADLTEKTKTRIDSIAIDLLAKKS